MRVREPARAGSFYPDSADACRDLLAELTSVDDRPTPSDQTLLGGIVPHAGWVYSGRVAAGVVSTLAADQPKTVVIFGAVHFQRGQDAWMFGAGCWQSPLGRVQIDERLAERVLGQTNLIQNDPLAHEQEHSIEVQVPFIQTLMSGAKILPILVPPTAHAVEVGRAVAGTVAAYDADVVFLGSTDLTHYGPNYGMTTHGIGPDGIAWAKKVNDRRMIDLMLDLQADQVVPEAARHRNACGSGAVAATLAAVLQLGADAATLLQHTNSAEISPNPKTTNAVGYAGMVFSRRRRAESNT
ncbi:MAG: AmmeMemoRadiSam system protein B [Phycisphaerae bacterium]